MKARLGACLLGFLAVVFVLGASAQAQSLPPRESELDPALFRIDENRFLGVKPDPGLKFRDESGRAFTFGEMTGRPLILVMSYYNCDGTCSLVNKELVELLQGVKRLRAGADYRILTVSFDPRDTAASLADFLTKIKAPETMLPAWRFSVPTVGDGAAKLAETIGFKYFWSQRDNVFLHPGVFAFLSSEGRVVRYLYVANSRPLDIELALLDAKRDILQPNEISDLALSICYSYNYKSGQYSFNYPLVIGLASLFIGIGSLLIAVFAYKRRSPEGELIK